MTKAKMKEEFKLKAQPVKPMSEPQKRHMITRVREISIIKQAALNIHIDRQRMKPCEMHASIKNVTAKLLPFSDKWEGGDWFEFPAKKKYDKKKDDQVKRKEAIQAEEKRLLDAIHLKSPDSATALSWLAAFEKF